MADQFQGSALALSSDGFDNVAGMLGVMAAEVWTVLKVETSGCGFLPDRRPQILYERHIFHRLTGGQFDDGNISDPSAGGYLGGAAEYTRLAAAIALDANAALQSASWGIGQVLGENFKMVGYPDVQTMVDAMCASEDNQLAAVGSFIVASNIAGALRNHDWRSFARVYNGANFAKNQYDVKLNDAFQKFSAGPLPDILVRTAQLYLTFLGYSPHGVDGVIGRNTLNALNKFQADNGLPASNTIDQNTVSQIQNRLPGAQASSAVGG